MNRDQLAARLLATFIAELDEQVRAMNAALLALEATPADPDHLKLLFRVAHTLKGAARAAGVPIVEQACHALETLLAQTRDGKLALGAGEFALLFSAADALNEGKQRLKAGRDLSDSPLAALPGRLKQIATLPPSAPASTPESERGAPDPPTPNAASGGHVRVEAEKLDALLAATGQLLVASGRSAGQLPALHGLHDLVVHASAEWTRSSRRLRLALERAGSPAALIQAVTGMEEHLRHVGQESSRLAAATAADARALAHATNEVADQVRRLRMRPFAEACEALPRVVRDLVATSGKDVALEVAGAEVEADRSVLDGLREALLHLVRNAVDHGIEPPQVRERGGKPRRGTVRVTAALRGDRIIVTVADDGAGLDAAAVRAEVERRGLSAPQDARELIRLLFEGGLSTRREVTAISGRGVGLDIVRNAVARMRGTVDVSWTEDRGTTFTLECPPTLATIRALLVTVGPQIVALPTTHVERLVRVRPEEVKHAEGRDVIATAEAPVPLVTLGRLLAPLAGRRPEGPLFVVLLRATGGRRLGVAVDELVAEQEIVLRPLGRGRSPLPHLSGAAILSNGRVALVLDPAAAVATGLGLPPEPGLAGAAAVGEDKAPRRRILVVDDSITTRTLEQSILEAAGYEVRTAVDGADAWRSLQQYGADLVVADVEMPRMDGFTLCEAMRGSKRFTQVPVVLVTALETDEHRARGLEVGADAYLGKSSFDQHDLLDTIAQLIGSERA